MFILYKQDGETLYGIKEFLVDSSADLPALPTNIKAGSTALIISTGELFILNSKKKWVLMGGEGSSIGGDETNCSCEELFSQLDQDDNDIIDQADMASSIELTSF